MSLRDKIYKTLIMTNFLCLRNFAIKFLSKKYKLKKAIIDIGSTCNAKCPYCPRQEEGKTFEGNGLMTEEVFNTVYEQLKKIKSIKTIALYAFGEPLLNKNAGLYIKKMAELNRKLRLSTNTTNMEKYTEELMLLNEIQFSIEGWDKESYEKSRKNLVFEKTIERLEKFDKAIKERRSQGLKTPTRQIHCLYTKSTNLEEFIKLWGKYTDEIRLTPMAPYVTFDKEKNTSRMHFTEEMKEDCLKFNRKENVPLCHELKHEIAINSNGKAVLCCCDFSHHLDLGDYRNLKGIFNHKNRKEIITKNIANERNICSACMMFFEVDKNDLDKHFPNLLDLKKYENENLKIII